jgi:hypothetical protein
VRPATSSGKYHPGRQVQDRKQLFNQINNFIRERNGWVTSVPGDTIVRFETLPDSSLPEELCELGYGVVPDGEGQRILPAAIVERFTKNTDGTLGILTERSTLPVTTIVHHAGIARVLRLAFALPP